MWYEAPSIVENKIWNNDSVIVSANLWVYNLVLQYYPITYWWAIFFLAQLHSWLQWIFFWGFTTLRGAMGPDQSCEISQLFFILNETFF